MPTKIAKGNTEDNLSIHSLKPAPLNHEPMVDSMSFSQMNLRMKQGIELLSTLFLLLCKRNKENEDEKEAGGCHESSHK
jgi:hypothetical protein